MVRTRPRQRSRAGATAAWVALLGAGTAALIAPGAPVRAAEHAAPADTRSFLASGPTGPATLPPLPPPPDEAVRRGAVAFDADALPPPPTAPPTVATVVDPLPLPVVTRSTKPVAVVTDTRVGSASRAVVVGTRLATVRSERARPVSAADAGAVPRVVVGVALGAGLPTGALWRRVMQVTVERALATRGAAVQRSVSVSPRQVARPSRTSPSAARCARSGSSGQPHTDASDERCTSPARSASTSRPRP